MIDSKEVLNNIINTTSPKSIVGQMASLYKKIDDGGIRESDSTFQFNIGIMDDGFVWFLTE